MRKQDATKPRSYTGSAFRWLLVAGLYMAVILVFYGLMVLTEMSLEQEGLYVLFFAFFVFMLICSPVILVIGGVGSLVKQIVAFRQGEPKQKLLPLAVVTAGYFVLAVLVACRMWPGMFNA